MVAPYLISLGSFEHDQENLWPTLYSQFSSAPSPG